MKIPEEIEGNFEKKIDLLANEMLASSYQTFLLETKNRQLAFDAFLKLLKEKIAQDNKELEEFTEREESYRVASLFLQVFDIEKARNLIKFSNINYSKDYYFIISFYSITREAQNSLLKFLEDTGEKIKVVLIVHKGIRLIETLLSRSYKLEIEEEQIISEYGEEEFLYSLATKFLNTRKLDRMKIEEIKDLLDRKDEYALEYEDKERADREFLEKFFLNLYNIVSSKLDNLILSSENIKTEQEENKSIMLNYEIKEYNSQLEKIREAISLIKNHSSSGKFFLEYLALALNES